MRRVQLLYCIEVDLLTDGCELQYLSEDRYRQTLWKAAAVAFVLLVPVFLITTSVRWGISAPFGQSYGLDRYGIQSLYKYRQAVHSICVDNSFASEHSTHNNWQLY